MKHRANIKLLLLIIVVLFINLSGCEKKENLPLPSMEAYFGTSTTSHISDMIIESDGNGAFVVIKNSDEWIVNVTYPQGDEGGWCLLEGDTELHGSGDRSIWIATQPNRIEAERTVFITIVGKRDIIPLTLTQRAGQGVVVPVSLSASVVNEVPLIWNSTGFDIAVISNAVWNISFSYPGGTAAWCSVPIPDNSGNRTISVVTASNSASETRSAVITITAGDKSVTLNVSQEGRVVEPPAPAIRLEYPAIVDQRWFLDYMPAEFAMEYDITKKHSKWVAWRLHEGDFGDSGRTDAWRQDERIPAEYRATASNFPSGYDRGHLCPSGERTKSVEINRQTFYYSNMSPQRSDLNQGVWSQLEIFVRDWAQQRGDTLYICAGGAITNNQPIIGYENGLAIPKYHFKVVLRKRGADMFHAIGFWFENKNYPARTKAYFMENLDTFIKSVDEIEILTGLDFFHSLPADIQNMVEAQKNRGDWRGF